MANKEYTRMISLGEWLENYLNPDIKVEEYRALIEKFVALYNIDFELKENDLILKFLELLEQESDEVKGFYQDSDKGLEIGTTRLALTDKKKDPLKMKLSLEKLILDYQKDPFPIFQRDTYTDKQLIKYETSIMDGIIDGAVKVLFDSLLDKRAVIDLLEMVHNGHDKWEKTFFKLEEGSYLDCALIEFGDSYSKLGENLVSNLTTKEVSIKKQFTGKEQPFFCFLSCLSVFRWDIAVARVFLDFLRIGGQDRICFCKHCGRFTVIKREKRKEFCSGLCRSRQHLINKK